MGKSEEGGTDVQGVCAPAFAPLPTRPKGPIGVHTLEDGTSAIFILLWLDKTESSQWSKMCVHQFPAWRRNYCKSSWPPPRQRERVGVVEARDVTDAAHSPHFAVNPGPSQMSRGTSVQIVQIVRP